MSNTKRMMLNNQGQVQWLDIGDNAVVRFVLDNGGIIECCVVGNRLDVRAPVGRLSAQPRFSNGLLVGAEQI